MPNLFFTSDHHFSHQKILTIGNCRPFSTIKEHDEELIRRWNEKVGPEDVVFHLGDFIYKSSVDADFYLKKLNGKKYLIIGNQDNDDTVTSDGWEAALPYQEVTVNNELITLCHYPISEWNGFFRGAWMFHGHVHGIVSSQVPIIKNRVDVGVDNFNFAPATFDEIKKFNNKSMTGA